MRFAEVGKAEKCPERNDEVEKTVVVVNWNVTTRSRWTASLTTWGNGNSLVVSLYGRLRLSVCLLSL